MSLPSRYAPEGLSRADQSKVITSGTKREHTPVNYILRTIDDKIQSALHHQQHGYNNEDIEMIPIEDEKEVDVISSYIEFLRGDAVYPQSDENIVEDTPDSELVEGNISFLILDTNFLISHLKIVDALKELASEYGLKLIIPVYVIQELDGLKNSDRIHESPYADCSGESISQLAKWANKWVYHALADFPTVVKGQKLSQRISKNLVKDDAIFDCCLYFKERNPNSLIILLSNDKNLCAKALSNDVLTVSFREHMDGHVIAKTIYEENVRRFGKLEAKVKPIESPSKISEKTKPLEPSPEWLEKAQQLDQLNGFDDVRQKAYTEIQMVLLAALDHCMVAEYGEDLDLIRGYDKNHVVNIHDCANVLIRFWMTVFQQYFKHLPNKFVPFEEIGSGRNVKRTPIYDDLPSSAPKLREFVEFWTTVLTVIYDGVMDTTQQAALQALINRWHKMAAMA